MPANYPTSAADTQGIYLSDTDARLSSDAKRKNNTRYLYFKKVALGGKCLIQSCKDLHLGRVVCYKSLRSEFADDPKEQQLFLREARVTAMLQHPNTAPVYEVGYDPHGHYYFTMKLVSGITLREILDGLSKGNKDIAAAWDLHRLMDVIIQIGQVLSYAHVHGVAHCDVKPENIVAGSFGEVLLLDWGLAHVQAKEDNQNSDPVDESPRPLKSKESHQGTPQYMSPEQIAGDDIDHRTDIYSLGAILFEILTGHQLAWGDTLDEMLQNKLHKSPPAPRLVTPDRHIPSALESICQRCIQRDPEHRIQTALKLIHELLYWLRTDTTYLPV